MIYFWVLGIFTKLAVHLVPSGQLRILLWFWCAILVLLQALFSHSKRQTSGSQPTRYSVPVRNKTWLRTRVEDGGVEGLTVSSLFPNLSLLNRKTSPGDGNSWVSHTSLCSRTSPFTVDGFSSQVCQWSCWQWIRAVRPPFVGNTIRQGRKGQQWLLWAVPDLPAMSQLVCLTSDHFQYLFNCYPQNYPIIIKSYHFNIQVSVSLLVFQSLFTSFLSNICSLSIILCHLFSPSHPFHGLDCRSRVCAALTTSQSSLCSPGTCLTPIAALILQRSMTISKQFVMARLSHPNLQRWARLQVHLSHSQSGGCVLLLSIIPL